MENTKALAENLGYMGANSNSISDEQWEVLTIFNDLISNFNKKLKTCSVESCTVNKLNLIGGFEVPEVETELEERIKKMNHIVEGHFVDIDDTCSSKLREICVMARKLIDSSDFSVE